MPELMHWFYYTFNLHFNKSQHSYDSSDVHVVTDFVSSEIVECRLSKRLLDHPMKKLKRQTTDEKDGSGSDFKLKYSQVRGPSDEATLRALLTSRRSWAVEPH